MQNAQNNLSQLFSLCGATFFLLTSTSVFAKDYLVDSPKAYKKVMKNIEAGDVVILKNGVWTDFEIVFKGVGKPKAPIKLTAETKGKVILSGNSNLRLAGQYLEVSGLVFKDGFTPSSEVISFRRNKDDLAFNSRVTEVVIDNYSNPNRDDSDYWVGIYGQNNRFDHNYLAGKRNKGVTLAVRLTRKESQENHHKIDHNYFGPRPIFGSNGGETVRIGTSHHSLTDSFTVLENNYFDRCDGEVEIISVKSGKNVIRNNTFFESRGTLTLRHGNGNLVENNVFFGNGVDHTGGIRVINRDQIVKNNYLEGLTGYRFGSGFTVMNGVPNSPINRYHQVDNATITQNSFINVDHIHLAAGSDAERSAAPTNSVMSNNLIVKEDQQNPFSIFDDISGIKFENNVANKINKLAIKSGVKQQEVKLTRNSNGLLMPAKKGAGASDLVPTQKSQTGPSWYAKQDYEVPFGSAEKIAVSSEEGALFTAVKNAPAGATLVLEDGTYDIAKMIQIDKTITLAAKNTGKAQLNFGRTTLFEIQDGGSLALEGLHISGTESPDSSGNTLIRTIKWGMLENYRLAITNSTIENLDVNHSFHVFDSGIRAFATSITLKNNVFKNITGDVLRLNKEIEDLGIYNAEYVTVVNNTFDNVQGALVNLYRGGSDESTFGPHLTFKKNQVINSGLGKRNKAKAGLHLHGVQVTNVANNEFVNSAPITVEHTVGEPITKIENNVFQKTAKPSVVELRAKGPHTAILNNNKVTGG